MESTRMVSNAMAEIQNATAHSFQALDSLKQDLEARRLSRRVAVGIGSLLAYALLSSD
tara:strand:- start:302 stop:475 length:174 start_codon:yes stop_codon:yes gene_type:complete